MSDSDPGPAGGGAALAACPTCKAVFRGGFQRCPNDGTRLDPTGGDPLVGSVLAGRYHIEGVLGDGGIGRVYRARHVRMSRRFAIKVPFGELGYDRKARARFANEAEAASRLSHPNVIGVVDVGETPEGLFYMAMDLAEGSSLADVIGDGPIVPSRVLAILIQLADGLAHAHDRGLVHRDLKPENVILGRGGDGHQLVRIVDFGLAIVDTLDKPRDRLTTEGVVLGTPHYMAPEQATDEQLDFRVDLFALGIIVFEMLAGIHPFDGGPMDVARQNLSRELPSILDRSGIRVDPLLEALVSWLTRKAPAQRPASAGLVAQFARHLAAGHRGAAHAMLPPSLITGDLPPFTELGGGVDDDLAIPVSASAQGTGGVSFPPPVSSGAVAAVAAESAAAAKHSEVPVLPPVAEVRPPVTDRVEREAPSSARRWIVVGLVLALLGGVLAVALVLGGKRSRGAGAPDAAMLALIDDAGVPDAAVLVLAPDVDAAVAMLDEPVDAGAADARPGRRADAAVAVRPPVDAAVAVRPPVDAAVAVRPPPDAAPAATPDPPATSLKGLYAQVGQALDAAMTKHGRDRTQALRDRYSRIPPYLEAVRKPELRTQAETQLKALLRDLATLK